MRQPKPQKPERRTDTVQGGPINRDPKAISLQQKKANEEAKAKQEKSKDKSS